MPKRNVDDAEARLARLRALVTQGIDDLDQGRYVELTTDDLEAGLDRLFAKETPCLGEPRVPLTETKKLI
jgi:hypothetical protein